MSFNPEGRCTDVSVTAGSLSLHHSHWAVSADSVLWPEPMLQTVCALLFLLLLRCLCTQGAVQRLNGA